MKRSRFSVVILWPPNRADGQDYAMMHVLATDPAQAVEHAKRAMARCYYRRLREEGGIEACEPLLVLHGWVRMAMDCWGMW